MKKGTLASWRQQAMDLCQEIEKLPPPPAVPGEQQTALVTRASKLLMEIQQVIQDREAKKKTQG